MKKREPIISYPIDKKFKDYFFRFVRPKSNYRYQFSKKTEEVRIVLADTIITKDYKVAFVKNSKCGCTSIAHMFYEYNFGNRYKGSIHNADLGIKKNYKWKFINDTIKNKISFTTVRNPEKRIISAFLDLFIENQAKAKDHFKAINSFGYSKQNTISYKFDVFLDYVHASFNKSTLYTDRHFRLQKINIGYDIFKYSKIIKLENLKNELPLIDSIANIKLVNYDLLHKGVNQSHSNFFINSDQRAKIEKIYSDDYEAFNY
jgi:hypothetical protein